MNNNFHLKAVKLTKVKKTLGKVGPEKLHQTALTLAVEAWKEIFTAKTGKDIPA